MVENGPRHITVNWTRPPAIGLYTPYSYVLYLNGVSVETESETSSIIPAFNYTASGLNAATTYTFSIVVTNIAGNSPIAFYPFNTAQPNPPDIPTNFTVLGVTKNQIQLFWNIPFDEGAIITKYIVGYTEVLPFQLNSQNATFGSPVTFPATVTGLQPGSVYTLSVVAENAIGDSGLSNIVNATTTHDVPFAPLNVALVSNTTSSLDISWNASFVAGIPLQPTYPPVNYTLFEYIGTKFTSIAGLITTQYNITSLNPATLYMFELVACDYVGCSTPVFF